jgi:hypothetical protein
MHFGGKALPCLGYVGNDDVCFNRWLEELHTVRDVLADSETAVYVFDEGEQGQPAFEFAREGPVLFVSVIDAEHSGGEADPGYQRVACLWADFCAAFEAFCVSLRREVCDQTPDFGPVWWAQWARSRT